MSKDKHGHEYRELVAIQSAHVELWRHKLKGGLIADIAHYLARQNQPANDDAHAHRVFRGQDLVQIIMDWPELKTCYPPAIEQSPADLV